MRGLGGRIRDVVMNHSEHDAPGAGDQSAIPQPLHHDGATTPNGMLVDELLDRVRTDGPPPIDVVTSILCELCDALSFAHECGVIHGDLRPGRLLLGTTGRLHVLGFDADDSRAIRHAYAAPEVLQGTPATTSSDVYAAGVIAYELLTGRPLFGDNMDVELRSCIASCITPPSEHNPSCPPILDAAVIRALEERPADRWSAIGEMRRLLSEVGTPAPVAVRRWMDRAQSPAANHTVAAPTNIPTPPPRAPRGSARLPTANDLLGEPVPDPQLHREPTNLRSPQRRERKLRLPITAPSEDIEEVVASLEETGYAEPAAFSPPQLTPAPPQLVSPPVWQPPPAKRSRLIEFAIAFVAGAVTLYIAMKLLS